MAASFTLPIYMAMAKTSIIWRVGWLLIFSNHWLGTAVGQESSQPVVTPVGVKVIMHTSLGDIVLALAKDRAPVTVNNFLRYVDEKRFDGCNFYRAVKLPIILYFIVRSRRELRRALPVLTVQLRMAMVDFWLLQNCRSPMTATGHILRGRAALPWESLVGGIPHD
jgi:hypothetical protein